MTDTPNPGSRKAIEQGCKCPVLDNEHGRGWNGTPGVFVMRGDCPLHGGEPKEDDDGSQG